MASDIKVNNIKSYTGNTLTLGESGDTITLPSGTTFNASNATVEGISGGADFQATPKTASFTAVSGEGYYVNTTSSAITVTLPASPTAGDLVSIVDYAGTSATNNITINPNSNNFLGSTDNVVIKENRAALNLIYADATQGWTLTAYAKEADLITAPDAPTIGTATATGSTTATVAFTAPSNDGGSTITSYTATSNPSGITGVLNQAGSGTITVTGLAASTSYTFTVTATNAIGTSPASAASNSITTLAPAYDIEYFVLAGGGGGGKTVGGGGGGGGFRTGTVPSVGGATITVSVGGGGAGGTDSGTQGGTSQISGPSITTIASAGGGRGGGFNSNIPGGDGGSGGGGGRNTGTGGSGNTPVVSPPQGNNGGNASPAAWGGGGGGGAGQAGTDGTSSGGDGNGGNGAPSTITGSNVTYAGGGGGAAQSAPTPLGGSGGGGNGGHYPIDPGNAARDGTAQTGGGGGGERDSSPAGGDGGSGIVVLRMLTSDYSGTTTGSPTVTNSGGDTILKYTGAGTYTT